ncbi:hypothetical protein T439DRAFT_357065 [Meredithblackwellia eburnea MCA 4105]
MPLVPLRFDTETPASLLAGQDYESERGLERPSRKRDDLFAAAKDGKGKTQPYIQRELQDVLNQDFVGCFLREYLSQMGCALDEGQTVRATVVSKHWGSSLDENSLIPTMIIDTSAAVSSEDRTRRMPLPILSRCLPGYTTQFCSKSGSTWWLAYDQYNTGEVWKLSSQNDAIDIASNRFFFVQFGDCGSLSEELRATVSSLLHAFLKAFANSLDGNIVGDWEKDWTLTSPDLRGFYYHLSEHPVHRELEG